MRLPRFIHHAYAVFMGYFWLPCPACGRMFGGHEYRPAPIDISRPGRSWMLCPPCELQRARESLNQHGFGDLVTWHHDQHG